MVKTSTCWGRRTSLEKALLTALLILFVVVVATFVIVTLFVRVYTTTRSGQRSRPTNNDAWSASHHDAIKSTTTADPSEDATNSTAAAATGRICDSPECVRVAHRMLSFMEATVKPCDDFFHFACGGWQKENSVQGDETLRSIFSGQMVQHVDEALRNILDHEDSLGGLKVFKIAWDFYSSCKLQANLVTQRFETIQKLLHSLGTFYDNGTTTAVSPSNLTGMLAKLLMLNGDAFFDVGVDVDSRNSSRLVVMISLPSQQSVISKHKNSARKQLRRSMISSNVKQEELIKLPAASNGTKDAEFFEELLQSGVTIDNKFLFKFMKISVDHKSDLKMFQLIRSHLNRSSDDPDQTALESEIENFLTELRNIIPMPKTLKMADETGDLENFATVDDMQKMVPNIDWKTLLEELFQRSFSKDDQIVIIYPRYFRQLSQLLDKHTPREIQNAALAIFVRNVLLELTDHHSISQMSWQFCVDATKTAFPDILSAMYIRSFPPDLLWHIRSDISEMFYNLKVAFVKHVNDSDWLDERSKTNAKRKAELMKGHFVSSEILFDDKYVEAMHDNVTVTVHSFFENVMLSYKRNRQRMYDRYNTPTETTLFELSSLTNPFVVNAYYLHSFNTIVVTQGILFPPYYGPGEPRYVMYGSIGSTVGHEIMHGFDKTGIRFDADGNYGRWISDDSFDKFRNRSSCFQQFYHKFQQKIQFLDRTVTVNFDGNFTLNENLADNVGLDVAYQAYHKWKKENGEEPLLPGLRMSPQQLFFLSNAQASCASMSPAAYVFALELDEHTPDPERINGLLMNSRHFSEAFQCPSGSPMNPIKKCRLSKTNK